MERSNWSIIEQESTRLASYLVRVPIIHLYQASMSVIGQEFNQSDRGFSNRLFIFKLFS